jgi:hypothetical protein
MSDFQLFRIKVFPSGQTNILTGDMSRQDILKESVLSTHSGEFKKGRVWHIGNIREIEEGALYFRIGRIAKSTIEMYDEGNFIDQEFETAPYTHVVLDIDIGLAAIARKSSLSSRVETIASHLVRLFDLSEIAKIYQVTFEIDFLNDPEDFLTQLKRAYGIKRFWVDISRPNIIDVDKFVEAYGNYVDAMDGDKGKTIVKGDSLNFENIEAVTRSVASIGNEAGATIIPEESGKAVRKKLENNPVVLKWDDLSDKRQLKAFRKHLRELYRQIRGGDESE